MFRKLRNRFTLIQVAVIGLILISSFSVIYFTTKEDVNRRVEDSVETVVISIRENALNINPNAVRPIRESYIVVFFEETSFTYETNADLSQSEVEEIYSMIEDKTIEYDNDIWEHKTTIILDKDVMIFIDVTEQYAIINSLLRSLIIIGILALLVFTLISRLFSKNAIKPIEESYEKQKEFVENASHELRTPLAIMNSNLDILLNYPDKTDEEKNNWLRLLKDEVKNMTILSNSLLFLTKEASPNLKDVDLSDLINNKILMYDALLYESKITLSKDIQEDIVVKGMNTQLVQLFTNLFDNAVKYSADKKISINLHKKGNKAILELSNKTMDLNETNIKHLLERFYKVDESRSSQGQKSLGLGLSIANVIVENHQGKIEIELIDDMVTFKVTLQISK